VSNELRRTVVFLWDVSLEHRILDATGLTMSTVSGISFNLTVENNEHLLSPGAACTRIQFCIRVVHSLKKWMFSLSDATDNLLFPVSPSLRQCH
jgi:hypothetical protein